MADRYVAAMVREIETAEPWRPLDSVYFGGGTPSHIDPALLGRVVDALAGRHGIDNEAEISLEANPEDFGADRSRAFRSLGFNRVSFGAQSFDEEVLVALGRRHQAKQVESSVRTARATGFENISLDLIYGTPGETADSWNRTLDGAIELKPDHASAYALTVERGTPLGRDVAAGAPAPDPDVQADRFEAADDVLTRAGLTRYEVSNWARPGHECRYNLTVWAQGEYEAYGNGAHGYRHGVRYRNHRRIDAYINAIEKNESPRAGEEQVEGWDAELDRLFVGLRRTVGVATGPGTEALLASAEGRRLTDAHVVSTTPNRLRVAQPFLTDEVQRSVLAQSRPIVAVDGDA